MSVHGTAIPAPVPALTPIFPVIGDGVTSVIAVSARITNLFVNIDKRSTAAGPVAAVTVNAAAADWPLKVAVMSDVPTARPVARPGVPIVSNEPTEATPETAEVQLAVAVTRCGPSVYVPVATNC